MRQVLCWYTARLVFLVCLASAASTLAIAAAVAYPIKKSDNGRYLVDRNNIPYMIVGDSPQALMVNITEAEAEAFFADRQTHGFNTVWINLLCNTYTGGRPDASTFDGIVPFTALLPSSSEYDLGTPNEAYFAHVDRILQLAAGHGLQVLLDPIETIGFLDTMFDNDLARCRTYGRYLGDRYKNVDNILWLNGNDFGAWQLPSYDAVVLEVAHGILDNDTRHLHTVELYWPSSSSLDDANWTPILGLNATYTSFPTYSLLEQDYGRANYRPNFLVEARYEFEGASTPDLRKQEYWAMTSGATGQMYGNHFTWQFVSGWQGLLDSPGANEMGYLVELFAPRAWYELVPDTAHAVLTAGYGTYSSTGSVESNDYATAARTANGNLVIIYTPVVRSLTVNMSELSGPAVTRWYDPTNGTYVPIAGSPFPNSGSQIFTPPGNNSVGDGDWVLVLETPGACTGPNPVVCTALDQCHDVGVCDTSTGACSNPAKPNGTACNDGDTCTLDEVCSGGVCAGGVARLCDDGNACTADVCDPSSGCLLLHMTANLDERDFSALRVDGRDLVVLADAWNSCPGDTRYNAAPNLDEGSTLPDACIDLTDFHLFMNSFGQSCP